jgi:hypothetical protein
LGGSTRDHRRFENSTRNRGALINMRCGRPLLWTEDIGVDLCGRDIGMPEAFLDQGSAVFRA